jgi:hydrogenase expression/formation protein HypE
MIRQMLDKSAVKFMRDPTRGGVATVLNELVEKIQLGIEIDETSLPINKGVQAMCELLGFDPLHIANEGKVVIVASENEAESILNALQNHELGKRSAIIGRVVSDHPGRVVLRNETGGRRIIDSLSGDLLPRIC